MNVRKTIWIQILLLYEEVERQLVRIFLKFWIDNRPNSSSYLAKSKLEKLYWKYFNSNQQIHPNNFVLYWTGRSIKRKTWCLLIICLVSLKFVYRFCWSVHSWYSSLIQIVTVSGNNLNLKKLNKTEIKTIKGLDKFKCLQRYKSNIHEYDVLQEIKNGLKKQMFINCQLQKKRKEKRPEFKIIYLEERKPLKIFRMKDQLGLKVLHLAPTVVHLTMSVAEKPISYCSLRGYLALTSCLPTESHSMTKKAQGQEGDVNAPLKRWTLTVYILRLI